MAKIKRSVRGWSVAKRVETGRERIKKLTGNADFPTAPSWLPPFQTATGDLGAAIGDLAEKRREYRAAAARLRAATKRWDQEHSFLASRIELESEGDATKISGTGFPLHGQRRVAPLLPAPENLCGALGERAGWIHLMWDGLPAAQTYVIEMCADLAAGHWQPVLTVRKSSGTVKNLTSGTTYWFRVAGRNRAGTGPFSSPIQRIAP